MLGQVRKVLCAPKAEGTRFSSPIISSVAKRSRRKSCLPSLAVLRNLSGGQGSAVDMQTGHRSLKQIKLTAMGLGADTSLIGISLIGLSQKARAHRGAIFVKGGRGPIIGDRGVVPVPIPYERRRVRRIDRLIGGSAHFSVSEGLMKHCVHGGLNGVFTIFHEL